MARKNSTPEITREVSNWKVNRKLRVSGAVMLDGVTPPRRLPKGTRVSVMSYQKDKDGNLTGRVKVKVQDFGAAPEIQGAHAFGFENAFAQTLRGRPRLDGAPHAGYLRASGELPEAPEAPEATPVEAEDTATTA